MIYFKDYILITWGTNIAAYGPTSASPVMTSGWKTGLDTNYYHKMVIGNDLSTSLTSTAIYITDGNTIAKLTGILNGLAGNPPSAGTLTLAVLTLPEGVFASTMCLFGNKLMIGTFTTGNRTADIYPWDKLTTHSYEDPIKINEIGINSLLSSSNRLYISAGNHGNIYVSDGSSYRLLKRIPFTAKRSFSFTMKTYPNAMCINSNGNLLVGTSTETTNSSTMAKHGVYEIGINSKGYPVYLKNIISSGSESGINGILKVGVVTMFNDDTIYLGWQSGSTYGYDNTTFRMYTSYAGYVEFPAVIVSDHITPKTFKNIEFKLGYPLISGQGIKVSYRKNLTDAYTDLDATFDYTTLGGVISHNTAATITDAEVLQVKVALTQDPATAVPNNVELMYIKLW